MNYTYLEILYNYIDILKNTKTVPLLYILFIILVIPKNLFYIKLLIVEKSVETLILTNVTALYTHF